MSNNATGLMFICIWVALICMLILSNKRTDEALKAQILAEGQLEQVGVSLIRIHAQIQALNEKYSTLEAKRQELLGLVYPREEK